MSTRSGSASIGSPGSANGLGSNPITIPSRSNTPAMRGDRVPSMSSNMSSTPRTPMPETPRGLARGDGQSRAQLHRGHDKFVSLDPDAVLLKTMTKCRELLDLCVVTPNHDDIAPFINEIHNLASSHSTGQEVLVSHITTYSMLEHMTLHSTGRFHDSRRQFQEIITRMDSPYPAHKPDVTKFCQETAGMVKALSLMRSELLIVYIDLAKQDFHRGLSVTDLTNMVDTLASRKYVFPFNSFIGDMMKHEQTVLTHLLRAHLAIIKYDCRAAMHWLMVAKTAHLEWMALTQTRTQAQHRIQVWLHNIRLHLLSFAHVIFHDYLTRISLPVNQSTNQAADTPDVASSNNPLGVPPASASQPTAITGTLVGKPIPEQQAGYDKSGANRVASGTFSTASSSVYFDATASSPLSPRPGAGNQYTPHTPQLTGSFEPGVSSLSSSAATTTMAHEQHVPLLSVSNSTTITALTAASTAATTVTTVKGTSISRAQSPLANQSAVEQHVSLGHPELVISPPSTASRTTSSEGIFATAPTTPAPWSVDPQQQQQQRQQQQQPVLSPAIPSPLTPTSTATSTSQLQTATLESDFPSVSAGAAVDDQLDVARELMQQQQEPVAGVQVPSPFATQQQPEQQTKQQQQQQQQVAMRPTRLQLKPPNYADAVQKIHPRGKLMEYIHRFEDQHDARVFVIVDTSSIPHFINDYFPGNHPQQRPRSQFYIGYSTITSNDETMRDISDAVVSISSSARFNADKTVTAFWEDTPENSGEKLWFSGLQVTPLLTLLVCSLSEPTDQWSACLLTLATHLRSLWRPLAKSK